MAENSLVLDGQWRKSLSVVRSLGKSGVSVTVGEDTRYATSLYSKYAKEGVVYPNISGNPGRFTSFIISLIRQEGFDTLFPLEDASVELVSSEKKMFSESVNVAVPVPRVLERGLDKSKTLRAAKNAGVPAPKTYRVDGLADAEKIPGHARFPLIIKPRKSSGSRGIVKVDEPDDFVEAYQRVAGKYPKPLVQQVVEGDGYGCSMLFNMDGQERAYFMHKRIREYPVGGGPSTLRESVMDGELLEQTRRLFEKLKWTGVGMAEYKRDAETGEFKLMEVNPRFWGSLELAVVSGVDFPALTHRMLVDGDVEPVTDYDVGVQCRWLYPGDILNFASNLFHGRPTKDFFRFRPPNLHYDILSRDDPGPAWGRTLALAAAALRPDMWRMILRN